MDNSLEFSILAKYFENSDIKFHAFQNAHRYENNRELLKKKKDLYQTITPLVNLKIKYLKIKKILKNFLPIGSLRAECAKKYFEKKKLTKIFMICVLLLSLIFF